MRCQDICIIISMRDECLVGKQYDPAQIFNIPNFINN